MLLLLQLVSYLLGLPAKRGISAPVLLDLLHRGISMLGLLPPLLLLGLLHPLLLPWLLPPLLLLGLLPPLLLPWLLPPLLLPWLLPPLLLPWLLPPLLLPWLWLQVRLLMVPQLSVPSLLAPASHHGSRGWSPRLVPRGQQAHTPQSPLGCLAARTATGPAGSSLLLHLLLDLLPRGPAGGTGVGRCSRMFASSGQLDPWKPTYHYRKKETPRRCCCCCPRRCCCCWCWWWLWRLRWWC